MWQIVAPLLLKQKLLKPTDRLSLTRYCDTIAEYWRVTRELREKDYTYEAEKVGSGKMLRFNPLFIVQARHPLVSVRGATQSPLISASFSGVTLSPGAFPLGLPVSLSHRKTAPGCRFAGVVADAVRADAPSLSRWAYRAVGIPRVGCLVMSLKSLAFGHLRTLVGHLGFSITPCFERLSDTSDALDGSIY